MHVYVLIINTPVHHWISRDLKLEWLVSMMPPLKFASYIQDERENPWFGVKMIHILVH